MIEYSSADYLFLMLGHFLNSMEYHVARLEKDFQKYSDEWLHWNENHLTGLSTSELNYIDITPEQYKELIHIYHKMAKKLKGLEITLNTSFPLLLKIKINENANLKNASVDDTSRENGWHDGQTLWNNLYAVLKIMKLHLHELRNEYNKFLDSGTWSDALIVSMNKKFKNNFRAMREIILNMLSSLNGQIKDLILTFEGKP